MKKEDGSSRSSEVKLFQKMNQDRKNIFVYSNEIFVRSKKYKLTKRILLLSFLILGVYVGFIFSLNYSQPKKEPVVIDANFFFDDIIASVDFIFAFAFAMIFVMDFIGLIFCSNKFKSVVFYFCCMIQFAASVLHFVKFFDMKFGYGFSLFNSFVKTRSVQTSLYCEWMITTPLLIWVLGLLSKISVPYVLRIVYYQMFVVALGFLGSLDYSKVLHLMFGISINTNGIENYVITGFSFIFFALVIKKGFIVLFKEAFKFTLISVHKQPLQFLKILTYIIWNLFPLVWVLGAFEMINESVEVFFLNCCDFGAKIVYSVCLLHLNFLISNVYETIGEEELSQHETLDVADSIKDDSLKEQLEDIEQLEERHLQRIEETKQYIIDEKNIKILESTFRVGAYGSISKGSIKLGNGEEKIVAIKSVRIKEKNIIAEYKALEEIRFLMLIEHENIIKCFGFYYTDNKATINIVLEWFDSSLEDFLSEGIEELKKKSKSEILQRIDFLIEICKGIEFLHSKGIIHRDLKTANIMLKKIGNRIKPIIIDFGTAKYMTSFKYSLVGSIPNIAPEIVKSSIAGEKKTITTKDAILLDVYAFAILIWECFATENIYKTLSIENNSIPVLLLLKIEKEDIRPNVDHLVGITDDLLSLMKNCWGKDKTKRPQNFSTILYMLKISRENFLKSQP